MKISLDHLQQFATGCFGSIIENNAWHALRLPAPLANYYRQAEGSRIRLECPSSVRLRLVTDATRLSLGLKFGAAARPLFQGVVLADGKESSTFGPQEAQYDWHGVIFEQEQPQQRTLDIWLPHLSRADVTTLEVNDGASIEAAPSLPLRWLAYGDSITQGMTGTLPTRTHIARCALALEAEVFNLGIGGAKLDEVLGQNVPEGEFDLISIAYGTNDFNQNIPVETYIANARLLLTALREKTTAPIVLITTLTWAGRTEANTAGLLLDDYRKELKAIASEFDGIHVVDGTSLIPDGVEYFVDNVHPNDAGFELYASNLLPHLQQALKAL